MYLTYVALYFIEAIVFQMSFADFAIWQVEATTAKSVGWSPHTTVSTGGIYAI